MRLSQFTLDNNDQLQLWDEYVASHPNGTPYHLSCWIRTIQETYKFTLFLYVWTNDAGDIKGLLPCFLIKNFLGRARMVSIPFSDFCGPLFDNKHDEIKALKSISKRYKGKIKSFEIRYNIEEDTGFVCLNYYKRHVLMLSKDIDKVKKACDKRTIQYSIRKAKRSGVVIRDGDNRSGIEDFYRLNVLTRKKHGPKLGRAFFVSRSVNPTNPQWHDGLMCVLVLTKLLFRYFFCLNLNHTSWGIKRLFRHDQSHDQIRHSTRSTSKSKENEQQADNRRVNIKILCQTTSHFCWYHRIFILGHYRFLSLCSMIY